MTAPAGWYPDTTNPEPNIMRYWDGGGWTEHTHDTSGDPAGHTEAVIQAQAEAAQADAQRIVEAQAVQAQEERDAEAQREAAQAEASMQREAAHAERESDEHARLAAQEESVTAPVAAEFKIGLFGGKKIALQLAQENAELKRVIAKYGIGDVVEKERRLTSLTNEITAKEADLKSLTSQVDEVSNQLVEARSKAELQAVGLFDFEHPAESSAELADELAILRAKIKGMVQSGQAVTASQNFTFNNSQTKGKKFVKDLSKIMLRAYNAEAENCVKTVKAGNLATAQNRLGKVVEQVARQGTMIDLKIYANYHSLRLQELALASRHLQRLADEKEAEREQRVRLREEKRVEQELNREQEKLAKERAHILNAIAALEANGDLEGVARQRLALEDTEKAIADVDYRAANIRAGYVYVISNIGAFGREMVKIGMTRRLEPMDRIKELSDASVPFHFDIHALFFSADAVAVETMLHQTFAEVRVNKVNLRREFFNTTPDAVLEVLKAHEVELVEYTLEPAAEEFHISWPDAS